MNFADRMQFRFLNHHIIGFNIRHMKLKDLAYRKLPGHRNETKRSETTYAYTKKVYHVKRTGDESIDNGT